MEIIATGVWDLTHIWNSLPHEIKKEMDYEKSKNYIHY